jgi:hypothetical protein
VTRDQILRSTRPEDLFPGDADKARTVFIELSRKWHPDAGGDGDVFAIIASLYRQALDKVKTGKWEGSATLKFDCSHCRELVLETQISTPMVFGRAIIGRDFYAEVFEKDKHLVDHVLATTFTYSSNDMRKEFHRYLPKWEKHGNPGQVIIVTKKTPDLIRLRDVVTTIGPLEPRHTAWVISSLMNLACYLSHTRIVHMDISPDTYFISPEFHSGALLGGWAWSVERDRQVKAVSKRTHSVLPFEVTVSKKATHLIDLELIRLTAREISADLPPLMKKWAETPGRGSAIDQYKEWSKVLKDTFGARRFLTMNVTAGDVYKNAVTH